MGVAVVVKHGTLRYWLTVCYWKWPFIVRFPEVSWGFPWKMVIFHSHVNVDRRVSTDADSLLRARHFKDKDVERLSRTCIQRFRAINKTSFACVILHVTILTSSKTAADDHVDFDHGAWMFRCFGLGEISLFGNPRCSVDRSWFQVVPEKAFILVDGSQARDLTAAWQWWSPRCSVDVGTCWIYPLLIKHTTGKSMKIPFVDGNVHRKTNLFQCMSTVHGCPCWMTRNRWVWRPNCWSACPRTMSWRRPLMTWGACHPMDFSGECWFT